MFRLSILALASLSQVALSQASRLELEHGDHLVWIGNTFAERMQYFGVVEASLHARYPKHELVVRNLAWSADTVSLRPRPKDFGDIHYYLTKAKADVILACYGFNETWDYGGEEGLARFKDDLSKFLKGLQEHQYNGESAPEIVLYSPIACEADFVPDTPLRNRLLQLYAGTMGEVADSLDIHFVDLFASSRELFKASTEPTLTINGVHLSEEGYAYLLPAILSDILFAPLPDNPPLDAIRVAVLEKNDTFFDWYRTVNSFYIHGDRKNPYGTVNFPLERKKLLQMTAVRDRRIWAAARGEELPAEIDDSSTVEIPANLPGSRGGTSKALSPAEERAQFEVADGFQVELFASEREFPELRNPVAINFDAKGRLWVATMPTYPHALPGVKPNDQLIILEDTNDDGVADRRTVFAEDLYLPLGFEFGNGGVYLSQEPNLVFLEDTDGDDKADRETVLLHGFGCEDCHHAIHNFVWGPGGGLYMQESVFHHTQVETVFGPRRSKDNAIFRFDPRTHRLEIVSRLPPGGNPWGYAINRWGEHLYVGRHHNASLINQPESGNVANAPYLNKDTRNCGQEFISSRHWPDELQGKVFTNQYKNFQGVLIHDWTEKGTTFSHKRLGTVFEAHNKACIPVDLTLGPDGALYVADWYNPVLGHMQYSLRDERRDSKMGRIWRITYKGRPLDTPPDIAGADVEQLLDYLKAYENRTRYRARRVLWNLPDETLRPALAKWVSALDQFDSGYPHYLAEALWLHQQRGWINPVLFQQVSKSRDEHARAAAAHVLRFWAERLPEPRTHFRRLAADRHAKVRLETVTSSTWADPLIAADVLDIVADLPQDNYLRFAINNARKALAPVLKDHPMVIPHDRLAALPLSDQVIKALVRRPGLPADLRRKALARLGKEQRTGPAATLTEIISELDQRQETSLDDWLAILDATEFSSPAGLQPLLQSETATVRQAAYAAMFRSGPPTNIPTDADAFRAISRLQSPQLRATFLKPAKSALVSSESVRLQQAALYALGRVPDHDAELFQFLAKYLSDKNLAAAAAEALLARSVETWPESHAAKLFDDHLPVLASTPVEKRGEPAFSHASNLLIQIAQRLNRKDALQQIRSLQLVPVEIATVPDQLKFDREILNVPPRAPVELRLNNPDALQHNLVLCSPGSLEKVGAAVDALVTDPSAMQRDWIPDLPEVLHATPMANAKQSVVVRFTTPEKLGSYPFLCTVPGHWRIMKGNLIVSGAVEKAKVLILTGESEYGTHATLPALGKRLQEKHSLDVTHIGVRHKDGQHHFPGLADHLPEADLLILSLRFLNLQHSDYEVIDRHLREKPFIAVRTTTHLFKFPSDSKLAAENRAFPTRHFGTPYRGHHGHDTSQVAYVMAAEHPVMSGVEPRFWTPDFTYAVNPLSIDCTPLMVGQGLKGKERATFKEVKPHNHVYVLSSEDQPRVMGSPHPIVWTVDNSKNDRRALVATIGAKGSFDDPNVQRLYRNAILWCLGRSVSRE